MSKYYDLVNRKQIKDAIRIANACRRESSPFYGKTLDEAVKLWEDKAIKPENIASMLQVYIDNPDLLYSVEDIEILKALISHPENHRIRLINDGSYYTHRIWAYVTRDAKVRFNVDINYDIRNVDSAFRRMDNQLNVLSPAEKVDYLFKQFEVVYLQILMDAFDRGRIKQSISLELNYRAFFGGI